jgi:cystathionine beta-lyase
MTFDFDTIADSIDYGFGTDFSMDHTMMAGAQLHVKTAPGIIRALTGLAESGLYGWTSSDDPGYLQAIVDWMDKVRDWKVEKEWIVPSYGILQAMCASIRAFTKPGDGIIVQQPVYFLYFKAICNSGRVLVNNQLIYREDHYEIDFADLEEKMAKPENKLMILCNPHNPTMDVWEKEDLERIAALAKKYDVIVIVDEIFAEHVWEDELMVPYGRLEDAKDHCIICTSLGKAFNFTGTSHANIIIPDENIRKAYVEQRNIDHYGSLSPFMRAAVLGAYNEEGKAWIDALMEFSLENVQIVRNFFAENFPEVKVCRHRAGTLVWVDVRGLGLTEEAVAKWFERAGVEADLGSKYGAAGDGFLRLQIGMPKSELLGALTRLKAAWERTR